MRRVYLMLDVGGRMVVEVSFSKRCTMSLISEDCWFGVVDAEFPTLMVLTFLKMVCVL